MDTTYTTKFYGNLEELKNCGDLKEHSHLLERVIKEAFDGAFEDDPNEYDAMHKDIRITAEFTQNCWGEDYKLIDVDSHWHFKEFHGSFKYHYILCDDDTDETAREYDALLVTFYDECNTELHIFPVKIHVEKRTATVRNLYTASMHDINLTHFDKIRAY